MIINNCSGVLTYLILSKSEIEQVPMNIRRETENHGDFMVLANDTECEILENISEDPITLKGLHDFFIISDREVKS